jgi:beta-glucosidase/6-phospho-beta-glucosidase/beta-galactosidase
MIRIVSMPKAVAAGIAGAIAWEVVLRGLALAGLPLFDIVRGLGTLAFPDGPALAWWSVGMAAHALVGALWAIFYAYFFWSWRDWPPVLQGIVFSLLPATLALLLVLPQLDLMHRAATIADFDPLTFFGALGWRQPAGLLLGHLVFGAVVGVLYTRPVGYPALRPPRLSAGSAGRRGDAARRRKRDGAFIFATGIECSYPLIDGGRWRRDQMQATGHYRRWREDFQLARDIGVTHLRYGPPLHLVFQAPGRFDWDFLDPVMAELHDFGPEPIVDLCHFGLPAWLESFQNPQVPRALADYAAAFAGRYPWVRFYTPVNEMYVCARLSALDGLWNEQSRDETAFVTAVAHMARASAMMADAILARRPDAVFVNGESGEYFQACCPDPEIRRLAEFENERRFLPLDLLYARPVSDMMRDHLRGHGMDDIALGWFMEREVPRRTIVGIDYYEWNEKLIDADGHARALGELVGWHVIASQYYDRYRRPMMHTETNRLDARDAPRWLWRQWHNVQLLRQGGVPLVGFTWYSLTDQVDWDIALARPLGNVNPVGLFDLNRDIRSVGLAYRYLIEMHRDQPEFAVSPALAGLMA